MFKNTLKNRKRRYRKRSVKNVTQVVRVNEDTFEIIGDQDNFTIIKNGVIAFIVKDGKIIGVKDLRIIDKFIYYDNIRSVNDGDY